MLERSQLKFDILQLLRAFILDIYFTLFFDSISVRAEDESVCLTGECIQQTENSCATILLTDWHGRVGVRESGPVGIDGTLKHVRRQWKHWNMKTITQSGMLATATATATEAAQPANPSLCSMEENRTKKYTQKSHKSIHTQCFIVCGYFCCVRCVLYHPFNAMDSNCFPTHTPTSWGIHGVMNAYNAVHTTFKYYIQPVKFFPLYGFRA